MSDKSGRDERKFCERPEFRFGRRELAVEVFNLRADKSRLTLQVIQLRERLELVSMLSTLPPAAHPGPADPTKSEPPAAPAEKTV